MRTTLKRGLGRGAAPNGNGKAVLPPGVVVARDALPAAGAVVALARGLIGRIAMWLGIACLVVATGTAGGAYLYFHESVAAVAAKTPAVRRPRTARRRAPRPAGGRARDRLRRAQGRGHERALGHAHARSRRPVDGLDLAALVPARHARRDPLPRPDAVLRQDQRRLRDCGPQGSLQTVRALTGVQINYLITVNFRGFRQIVDRLGGAWIDVDRRYFNDRGGPSGYATINLRPGYQQLTGGRRSTTCATATRTPTSTASRGSSSS